MTLDKDKSIEKQIENFADNEVTGQCIIDMVERLMELEEINFRDGKPYWRQSGEFLDDCYN